MNFWNTFRIQKRKEERKKGHTLHSISEETRNSQ